MVHFLFPQIKKVNMYDMTLFLCVVVFKVIKLSK